MTGTPDFRAACDRFLELTDRQRWWTTPELAEQLADAGVWHLVTGSAAPWSSAVEMRNGPRAMRSPTMAATSPGWWTTS
jgi:hypothetical protein